MSEYEDDPLEGFRAVDQPDLSEGEAALLRSLEENRGLLQVINLGLDMQRFQTSPAGKGIWQDAERKLADSVRTWLSTDDANTPEARNAHFNARVAIDVLKTFQEAIDHGRQAATQMRLQDDGQPER